MGSPLLPGETVEDWLALHHLASRLLNRDHFLWNVHQASNQTSSLSCLRSLNVDSGRPAEETLVPVKDEPRLGGRAGPGQGRL